MTTRAWTSFGVLLSLAGCASTSPREARDRTRDEVAARSGHVLPEADAKVASEVDRIFARPLDVDDAVRVALLENADLRATLERLAIGRAELVQAGLLSNPVLTFGSTAWETEHIAPNLFGSIEQSFLDLVTIPLKKRVAGPEFEATRLRVAHRVLELAAETRHAFYEAEAAEQEAAVLALVDEAVSLGADLARRRHEAGTASDLALATEVAFAGETHVNALRSRGRVNTTREALTRKMGVWGARTRWSLVPRLPELPAAEDGMDDLENVAIQSRLDVDAARKDVDAMHAALTLAKTTRWTGTVSVAVEAGRLRDTKKFSFGPSVALEIPLFDQRTAKIALLEAHARTSEDTLRGLAVDVRSEVREARARVATARAVAHHTQTVTVPARTRAVQRAQERYDAMLLGAPQLFQAKQAELESYRSSIEALEEYWIARSELERAVGRRVGTPAKFDRRAPSAPESQDAPSHHGHDHRK